MSSETPRWTNDRCHGERRRGVASQSFWNREERRRDARRRDIQRASLVAFVSRLNGIAAKWQPNPDGHSYHEGAYNMRAAAAQIIVLASESAALRGRVAELDAANTGLAAESERLREGLRFYAHGSHWECDGDARFKWDTVSGEPQNWHYRENESNDAEGIEDGGIARLYLSGETADWEGEPPVEHPCEPVMKAIAEAERNAPPAASGEEKHG